MRRATAITLMLMGGGIMILSPFLSRPSQACADARAAHQPDAEEICRDDHGGGHGGGWHGSWSGASQSSSSGTDATHTSAGSTSSSTSVERGGFGSTGFHFFHFGG